MGFLSPWFLLGTLAVGVPLWLHLIRREQAVRLPFSSLMFLRRIPIKSVSRQRLKYFLLLSTRLLVVLLITLAFARLYFPSANRPLAAGGGEKHLLVLLDTSLSMQYGERWQRALAAAREAVAGLRERDQAQIVTFAAEFQVQNLPTSDKAALQAVLSKGISPTASPTSYAQAFRAVDRIAEDTRRPLSVVFISDLQKSGLGNPPQSVSPPVSDFRIVNVAEPESPNWTIEGARSRRVIYKSRYPDRLVVQLRGFATPETAKEVTFSLRGKVIEKKTVQVPASGNATVLFEKFDVPLGENPARIEITPPDRLPADDSFYFTLERREPHRLLFLREAEAAGELYYFRSALAAEPDSPFLIEARTPAEAGSVPLREYAMVILSNVQQLSGPLVSDLRDFVKQGGGLLITAGSRLTPALETQLKELWPGKVLQKRLMTREGERLVLLGEFDKDHPVFRELRDAGADSLRSVEVFAYLRIQPEGNVLLRFSNGDPALLEKPYEQGRVLLFASSFDNVWSDFPLHPAFVPLLHQLIHYTAQLTGEPPAYAIPSAVSLENYARGRGDASSSRIWNILGPDGKREVPLAEEKQPDFLVLRRPGFYEVRQKDRTHLLAANPDPRESDLAPLSREDQALWMTSGRTQEAGGDAAVAGERAKQQAVWWYLLLLALLVAAVEVYLANQYLGPRRIAVSPE